MWTQQSWTEGQNDKKDKRTVRQKDNDETVNVKLLLSKSFLTAFAETENCQSDYEQRQFYFLFPNFEVKF